MSQIMARVRVRSGLTRYRSLRTLLTSTGGSSKRVLDGALQASLYSRSAESNVMLDPMFIEFSAQYPVVTSASTQFGTEHVSRNWHQLKQQVAQPRSRCLAPVYRLPKC